MTSRSDVLVVGAGISGLSVAWALRRRGVNVEVIESAQRAGGTIGTVREEGCLIETGPNSTLETSPLIGKLLEDVGIAGERIYASAQARKRFVLRGGRLIALPLTPPAFVATPLLSWRAKLAVLREPFVPRSRRGSEESVAQFVRRRLGPEFLDYAINPFVAGVYAGDPDALSVTAAFPRLYELEQNHGSLIRGQIFGARERKSNPEKSKQAAAMFSFRDGMQTLTDAIATRLERIRYSIRAVSLARDAQGGWQVAAQGPNGAVLYRTRSLVLATPAYVGAQLVGDLAPAAARALGTIKYPPVASVASLYARNDVGHSLDGFGFLVPQTEQRRLLGTLFSSTLFDDRAPPGMVLLTSFVGGMRQPELVEGDKREIATLVHDELGALLRICSAARRVWVTRWDRAIPQYSLGHLDRIAAIDAAERDRAGLFFCANYRGGISVADCIRSAYALAERVTAHLAASSGCRPA